MDSEPRRLDPDRAAEAAARRAARRPGPPPPVVDTRPYRRLIGLFGLTLFVVVGVAVLVSGRSGTAGIPAGQRLAVFAAPLASSNLRGDANLRPPCSAQRHDPRALNICLLEHRGPLVLAFFVTGSNTCEQQVDALQTVSRSFPQVQFAAVAVRSSHGAAAAAVRKHHWTIPVAYDADGAVAARYGIEVCPIVELAARGGRVKQRLIGGDWSDSRSLAARVEALLSAPA